MILLLNSININFQRSIRTYHNNYLRLYTGNQAFPMSLLHQPYSKESSSNRMNQYREQYGHDTSNRSLKKAYERRGEGQISRARPDYIDAGAARRFITGSSRPTGAPVPIVGNDKFSPRTDIAAGLFAGRCFFCAHSDKARGTTPALCWLYFPGSRHSRCGSELRMLVLLFRIS